MMKSSFLVITSIAGADHPALKIYAEKAIAEGMNLIVIGDQKGPQKFTLPGCDFYSIDRQLRWTPESRQKSTEFKLHIRLHSQLDGAAPV
jgi:hypothetical protein